MNHEAHRIPKQTTEQAPEHRSVGDIKEDLTALGELLDEKLAGGTITTDDAEMYRALEVELISELEAAQVRLDHSEEHAVEQVAADHKATNNGDQHWQIPS